MVLNGVFRPDILRSLLREGVLARIQPALLGPYLRQREDYSSSHLYRLVSSPENVIDRVVG
jgi:hypothetical protein